MRTMKSAIMFVALAAISAHSFAAMSLSDIRREARFLTDRMGYELALSNRQYEDVYEINFDFFYQVNEVIDDVAYGYDDAIDYYYYLLDVRNEDLMYVLRSRQYHRFIKRDYFYRPIYMDGNRWGMRIYSRYTDHNYYYYGIPTCYHTYNGAHYRIHYAHSYYAGLYHHSLYHGAFRLWGGGYHHHHHDGWHCIGQKKHHHHGSRPWSNAKNYEKSRRDLKAGYVSIPSRDENKRMVKVGSEENRRTAVTSNTPTRTGSARTGNVTGSRTGSSITRNSNATTTTNRRGESSNVGTSTRNSNATGTTRIGSSTSRSSSSNRSGVSSSGTRSSSSNRSGVSSSSTRSSSSNRSGVSSSSTRSSSSNRSGVSSSGTRSSSSNRSGVSSGSTRSSSSRSSSSGNNSSSSRSSGSRR